MEITREYFSSDTIAAVATSLGGDAGVGIVRISGARSLEVTKKITKGLESPVPNFLHRISVFDFADGQVIDDGLGVFFKGPHSFTGEDVVELQVHGGRYIVQSVLQAVLKTGKCRQALPGEFSFRAVRNGKMTLNEAQGLNQLIHARSKYESWSARQNMSDARYEQFKILGQSMKHLLSLVELSIDFTDQDIEVIPAQDFQTQLNEIISSVDSLSTVLQMARRVANGLQVVLVGDPNAGKSSLFNSILGLERAIVSEVPGTTRDYIGEFINLDQYRVQLIDTAGIREASEFVESKGIDKSLEFLKSADVVILMIDASEFLKDRNQNIHEQSSELSWLKGQLSESQMNDNVLVCFNKCDLIQNVPSDKYKRILMDIFSDHFFVLKEDQVFFLSSLNTNLPKGLTQLLEGVRSKLDSMYGLALNTPCPTEIQLEMLRNAREGLLQCQERFNYDKLNSPELISGSLYMALLSLEKIIGFTDPDDILNSIFRDFCIGK